MRCGCGRGRRPLISPFSLGLLTYACISRERFRTRTSRIKSDRQLRRGRGKKQELHENKGLVHEQRMLRQSARMRSRLVSVSKCSLTKPNPRAAPATCLSFSRVRSVSSFRAAWPDCHERRRSRRGGFSDRRARRFGEIKELDWTWVNDGWLARKFELLRPSVQIQSGEQLRRG